MFKKLLSGIMAIAVCVVGLSGCGESPPEEVVMPEIVFVKFFYYPEPDAKYDDFTKGYFIEKSGVVKYFEIKNENLFDYRNITITKVKSNGKYETKYELNGLLTQLNKIKECAIDSHCAPVNEYELKKHYTTLLKVDNEGTINYSSDSSATLHPQYGVYGIRYDESNSYEVVMLQEYGEIWSICKDKKARNLFLDIYSILGTTYEESSAKKDNNILEKDYIFEADYIPYWAD